MRLLCLENNEIKRLGSNDVISNIKVRIISATNNNLYEKCKSGTFRWDLYYRLCSQEIYIIPYRERILKDRKAILQHFLQILKKKWGKDLDFKNETIQTLEKYSFIFQIVNKK